MLEQTPRSQQHGYRTGIVVCPRAARHGVATGADRYDALIALSSEGCFEVGAAHAGNGKSLGQHRMAPPTPYIAEIALGRVQGLLTKHVALANLAGQTLYVLSQAIRQNGLLW